jgi:hypothetical protein
MNPEIDVEILELRDLKHNGGHRVEVTFLGKTSKSQFIDGYGAFKPVRFFTSFPLTESQAIGTKFWELNKVYISVIHERMLMEDKLVGECAVSISGARNRASSLHGEWVHLRYKGENRGSIKVRIMANKDVPTPAISATVSPVPSMVLLDRRGHKESEPLVTSSITPSSKVSSDWPQSS